MNLINTIINSIQIIETLFIISFLLFIITSGPLFKLLITLIIARQFVWILSISVSTWWRLMLFLVYISGILITYAYFTSFSGKERWNTDFNLIIILRIPITLIGIETIFWIYENQRQTWILERFTLYIVLGIFLLNALIVRCIICYKKKHPLRPFIK